MNEQAQAPEHPDPDRWWRRKFKLACICTGFAAIVLLIGLFWARDSPLIMSGVWAFLVPMLAYLGLAEVNSTINTIYGGRKQ